MLKKFSRAFALIVVPFLGSLLIRLLYLSNKKVFHVSNTLDSEPKIFACWHGELLMLPYLYSHYRKKPNAKVIISSHFDGKLISKTVKYFGLDTIAGSSNKNPARTLIQALKALKEGCDIGITPDGPKGPRHKLSDGTIIMAQKTGAKVILVNIKPTKFWQLNSWDKFIIPKPFGTLHYYATEPIDLVGLDMNEARALVKKRLLTYE